jgi:hypothetical protein
MVVSRRSAQRSMSAIAWNRVRFETLAPASVGCGWHENLAMTTSARGSTYSHWPWMPRSKKARASLPVWYHWLRQVPVGSHGLRQQRVLLSLAGRRRQPHHDPDHRQTFRSDCSVQCTTYIASCRRGSLPAGASSSAPPAGRRSGSTSAAGRGAMAPGGRADGRRLLPQDGRTVGTGRYHIVNRYSGLALNLSHRQAATVPMRSWNRAQTADASSRPGIPACGMRTSSSRAMAAADRPAAGARGLPRPPAARRAGASGSVWRGPSWRWRAATRSWRRPCSTTASSPSARASCCSGSSGSGCSWPRPDAGWAGRRLSLRPGPRWRRP